MRAIPFPSVFRADPALLIALGCVALFGAAELASVAFHYASHRPIAEPLSAGTDLPSTPSLPTAPTTTGRSTPAAPLATRATAPVPAGKSDQLLREAIALRERGDTTNALARLQQAAQSDPKNASVLAEMAMIYESIQLYDRSNETWRRLQEIGTSAGALYELADLKLKMGVPTPAASPAAAVVKSEVEGIPDGSTFGISEVTPTLVPDPEAETHLTLRVAVKARPKTPIDYTKVKIQVFFYDIADNERVVLTDAEVNYEWLTPNHNWTETNPEVLAVTYLRPKKDAMSSDAAITAAAAAVTPPAPGKKASKQTPLADDSAEGAQRKYLGYIVRVYYSDQLQAVRADPTKLLNLFPPPFTAPSP